MRINTIKGTSKNADLLRATPNFAKQSPLEDEARVKGLMIKMTQASYDYFPPTVVGGEGKRGKISIFRSLLKIHLLFFTAVGGLILLTSLAHAAPSGGLPPQAQAPLKMTIITDFKFGHLAAGVNGGSVSFSANAGIQATGDVVPLGGEQKGTVSVQANAGEIVTVVLSRERLNGPGPKLNLISNCIGPGGTLGVDECTFTATGGTDVIRVGGILSVASEATQTSGHYSQKIKIVAKGP